MSMDFNYTDNQQLDLLYMYTLKKQHCLVLQL